MQATMKAVRPMKAVCAMKKEQVVAAVAPMAVATPAFAAAQVRPHALPIHLNSALAPSHGPTFASPRRTRREGRNAEFG